MDQIIRHCIGGVAIFLALSGLGSLAAQVTGAGENVLKNADFSQRDDSWQVNGQVAGARSIAGLQLSALDGQIILEQSSLNLPAGQVYELLLDSQATTDGQVTIRAGDIMLGSTSIETGYRHSSIRFGLEKPATSLSLVFSAPLSLDKVSLVPLGPLAHARIGKDVAVWLPNLLAPVPSSQDVAGRGAKLPFITTEAEAAAYSGKLIGPSRTYTAIAAEASNRQGVDLATTGSYLEFKAPVACNSILVRYAIPDANRGKGMKVPLKLFVNGQFRQDLVLTSEYVIVYGNFPWTNDAGQGRPRHFFDEVGVLVGDIAAGATIRLERPAENKAKYCIVDLVDTEAVAAPLVKPEGYLSIADFGAVPNDGTLDNVAIEACVKAVKKTKATGVWLPPGTWNVDEPLYADVSYRGAGMWHTIIAPTTVGFQGINRHFEIHDLAIFGQTLYRDDTKPSSGYEGSAGQGSVIENVWISHTKVGLWTERGSDGLMVKSCRIRNTMADGINLYRGTKNSLITQNHFRGTGDDAIALWSATMAGNTEPDSGNVIKQNTIQCPWLANGIAVYGGKDTTIEGNLVFDTILNGAGIDLSSNFEPVPFSGTLIVKDNTLVRCGSYNGDGGHSSASYEKEFRGALWIDLEGKGMDASLAVSGLQIFDATLHGITIEGKGALKDAVFSQILVNGASGFALRVLETAMGELKINGFSARNTLSGGMRNQSSLDIKLSGSNQGL